MVYPCDQNMGIQSIDAEDDQFAYRYDTQLLIDRRDEDLDEDEIADYITEHFEGNSLIAAGDEDLVKIHFHTNEPWKVLEYCNSIGEIYDIVVEDMIRQAAGLQGQFFENYKIKMHNKTRILATFSRVKKLF